jgi:hypothetical protein
MRCAQARGLLQELHDEGRSPGGELAAHLAACADCSVFAAFLARLGADARDALDAAAAGMPRPDYAEISARAGEERQRETFRARRLRLGFAAAAAVLVAGIGIAAGARAWVGRHDRLMVASNVSGFVDELFASPLLANATVPIDDGSGGLRDWLEGSGSPFLP